MTEAANGNWYMVNKDGMATLCTDRADAEKEAADAQSVWPHMGPHRAVQLVEAGASLPLPGAQEAVAWAMFADNGNIRLWSKKPIPHPDAIPLYAAPQPALSAGWVSVDERLPEPDGPVLAHNGKWTGVAAWMSGEYLEPLERWQDEHREFIEMMGPAITHWMPLPPPPTSAEGVEHG